MHTDDLRGWQHNHVFGQDQLRAGEKRTFLVVVITAIMMVVEIAAGLIYGSMALLADGLHMASHAFALGLAVFAYYMSRRLATDPRFAFGVGKINSLAGFASAVLLAGFALAMVIESTDRLINPVKISFNQALIVAVIGFLVNGVCARILISTPHEHGHQHDHNHDHSRNHKIKQHDHNLRAAYLHVLADTLTSVLAIAALLAAKYAGTTWLDPAMGIVGAILVARWSYGLIRASSLVLLDYQIRDDLSEKLRESVQQSPTDRVSDLHCWKIGHGIYAAEIAIVSDKPKTPEYYKAHIPPELNIVHVTVEVHHCH